MSGNSWFSGDHQAEVQEFQNNPPIRQNGNSIRIDYVNCTIFPSTTKSPCRRIPRFGRTPEAAIRTLEGLKGNVELESGSGDLKLARLIGDMRFQTGSGNIRGRELSGPARMKAGSGDIDIEEIRRRRH